MNRADVELLNQSIAGLSNTMLQNRSLDQQAKEKELDRQMRERELEDSMATRKAYYNWRGNEATDAAKSRQQQLQERVKDFTHKTWDGNVKFFADQVKDGLMDPQSAKQALTTAWGNMPDQARTLLQDNPSAIAIDNGQFDFKAPTQKQPNTYGPILADKAAADLEGQADQLEQQAASVGPGGTDSAQQMLGQVSKLRERAKFLRQPRYDPSQFETVQTRTDPMTGQPVTTTTAKRAVGAIPAPAGATGATAPGAAQGQRPRSFTDKTGKTWRYIGTAPDPTTDRNPANWIGG